MCKQSVIRGLSILAAIVAVAAIMAFGVWTTRDGKAGSPANATEGPTERYSLDEIHQLAVIPPGPMIPEEAALKNRRLSRESKRFVEELAPSEVDEMVDSVIARARNEGGITIVSHVEIAALRSRGYYTSNLWQDSDGNFVDDEVQRTTFLEFYRAGLEQKHHDFHLPYSRVVAFSPTRDKARKESIERSKQESRRSVNEGYVNWPRSWKLAELIEERQINSFDELIELGYVPYKPAVENIEEIANRETLNKYTDQVQVLLETVYPQDKAARKMMAKAKALIDYQESYARALTEPDRFYSGYKEIEHLKCPQFFINNFTGEPMEFGNNSYQLYVEKDGLVQGIVECDVLKIRLPQP
ncbi:hypothetical protein J7J84_01095 [bacterium]|nr:hypothetical protein [bacterium]